MKLALGTVQFGMDYGINNKIGKVPKKTVFDILKYALKNNIDTLDTAHSYGESEKIIGNFIKKYGSSFNIISKIKGDISSVNKNFFESLDNLHLKRIYGLLIHDFNFFKSNPRILEIIKELKLNCKVEKIGFSVYYPKEIEYLLDKKIQFDLVQVPFSIFDQRFAYLFPILKEKGVEIHVRSVFLQGLVFKNPDELKDNFVNIKSKLSKLNDISKENNVPLSVICINFAEINPYIDKVIIGVDNLQNLKDNLDSLRYRPIVNKIYKELLSLRDDNEDIILPINWKQST